MPAPGINSAEFPGLVNPAKYHAHPEDFDGRAQKDSIYDDAEGNITNHEMDFAQDGGRKDFQTDEEMEAAIGVERIEAIYQVFGKGWKVWMLYVSMGLLFYVMSLQSNTTYVYDAFATSSFGSHTIVGTVGVATGLIASVAQPFIAKLSDITSRPTAFAVFTVFYAVGFAVCAGAPTVDTFVGGQVIQTFGSTGINLLQSIIICDISSLEWRGFVLGLASSPYILNAFVAGYISSAISGDVGQNWRWGIGMFAIIVPVCTLPVILVLLWADTKAKKLGVLSLGRNAATARQGRNYLQSAIYYWRVIDGFGLLLLGTAWSLLLLPFTLYTSADNGFKNPSLIAMFVVGGVLLIVFFVWEFRFVSNPLMPRRLLNRSFICSVAIDFNYYLSGYISDTYFSSWVYVIKDWSLKDYNFFLNALGVSLCLFGIVAGIIQRYTHRYKYLQLSGLAIRCFAMALPLLTVINGIDNDAVLIMNRILVGLGGAFSVVGSQVAVQASVPHRDMAVSIALLALWTGIGGSIGTAIAAAIWNDKLPKKLTEHLGDYYNATEILEIFGSITVARVTEPRDQVIAAYNETMYYLLVPALALSFLSLIAGCMTKNFYLGNTHNAIEDKVLAFGDEDMQSENTEDEQRK